MGKLLLIVSMVMVLVCVTVNMTNAQAGTLGFILSNTAYPDGSTVLRDDIGEGDAALRCTTDSITCCRNVQGETRGGQFYTPDGVQVPVMGNMTAGYYRTRESQSILLHRRSFSTTTGQFRCNIPQASGPPDADLYINIVDILVTISPSGDDTAGEGYSLMCTVTVTGSNDQPTITWLDQMSNQIMSTTGSTNTLTFNPLEASDAGTYTCRATLGSATETAEMEVSVQNPKITVSISADTATPTAGSMLTLTCNVGGADMISPTISYQWSRNGMVESGQMQQTWSFSSLNYSDAGQYSCAVDISSNILQSSINAASDLFNITLTLPDPTMVTVTSDLASPISSSDDVTLTCTVELITDLSSISSVGVAVTWTGPSGPLTSTSTPMMSGNPLIYTNTLLLRSEVVSDGTYTCQAMTTSSSLYLLSSGPMSSDITITIAPAATTETQTTTTAADSMTTKATTMAPDSMTTKETTMATDAMTSGATTTEMSMPTTQASTTSPSPASITDVSITSSGDNTAGESYSLECTVVVTGSTDQLAITWLMGPMNSEVRAGVETRVETTDSMSTLTFNPLAASHAGTYTCRAILGSVIETAEMVTVSVENPTITVSIASSVATPMAGSMYSLTCTVTGAEKLTDAMVTYQWFRSGEILSSETVMALSFQSLVISDAGRYTCEATVTSVLLSAPISTNSTDFVDVTLSLPNPTVMITSTPASPIRPVGSPVTLTCTVDLSPLLDVPVNVIAQISGPSGVTITPLTNSVMESTTRYTSTAMVSSFGRDQFGEYTCTATVRLVTANSFITGSEVTGMGSITVGTGVYLSLKGVTYANNSAIQITEIGQTNPDTDLNEGLQCITDRMPCCRNAFRTGEWYMYTPGRTMVPGESAAVEFYRTRGHDDGTVNLNRPASVMMPTGLFCCEVPSATGGDQTVCANIVSIGVVITSTGTPTAGETYSLDCSVTGTDDSASYQWLDSNRTQLANTSQLQFSPLLASHAGTYTCRATVGGVVVENSTTLEISFPAPAAVTVTAPLDVINGSSITLTCTVELSLAVDVPVTVTTEWSGPSGVVFMPANPVPAVMGSITTYTSTVSVDAARNGSYICQATITSGGTTSGSTDITVAPLPPPTNLRATSTATSITLTWEQPEGANAVDRYEINYRYIIEECDLDGVRPVPAVTVPVNDGTLRRYTLNNSASPVEEDSVFRITLTAVNDVTRSVPSQPAMTTTTQAAPGLVQSLNVSSVNVTGITIRWERVDCQERNGHTDGYRLVYYPTSTPSDRVARTLAGTEDNNRMFSVTGLPPRTSYSFEVQASNPDIDVRGPPALYMANTAAPQDLGFLLGGQLYPNNSVVTVTDIGQSFFMSALFCLSPSLECCSESETPNAASVTREWYLPDGSPVTSTNSPFIKSRVSSAVSLHSDRFSSTPAPSGVYGCEIPDASGTSQSIYVGIYPQGEGSPSITSLMFDRNSTTLTCTSTGGPPTTVSWRKNGVPVDLSLYERSQRLVYAESATYQSVLFNDNVTNFVGTFTCEVSNVRGTAQETTELNGVFIVRDQFRVGESATASCKSDAPATMIEWLRDGLVVESAAFAGIQELDLVFSPVNDSIHNQVYVCRVTREGGAQAEQDFTAIVDVPPTALTATVSSSGTATAGMVYSLTCTVSKTVGGLINSPSATWTNVSTGMAVSSGNGITVSTLTARETDSSMLTFELLRTSHNGDYSCDGTLTSPALSEPLMPSVAVELSVQISTPDVVVTVPPGPLFAGRIDPLTLTCAISINSATDTDIALSDMDVTWLRGSTRLSNGDARVTISSVSGSRPLFTSTLTLDPLSTADNTTFTCRARARPPPNVPSFVIASEMGEGMMPVVVNLPSPPTVSIDPFNRLEMAGQPLTLNCSASIQEGIRGTPELTWTREDASLSSDVTSSPPLLSFPSLYTSHAGRYTCTARLTIPDARVNTFGDSTTSVSIRFMPPPPIIDGSPRNTSFFQGLDLTFTCSITLGDVVDTPVTVRGIWNRNGTELMDGDENGRIIIVNPPMNAPPYQVTLRFNPLSNVTDNGTYECDVTVTPQDTTFISTATTSNSRTIGVAGFPTQFVAPIADEGVSTAGFSGYTLICNTSREPDLPSATTLAVEWLDPRGNVIRSGENFTISGAGSTSDVILTSRLVFNNLYTSQAGVYTCRTLQTIPETVTNHPETMTFPVRVKLPAPISPLTFRRSRNTTLNAGTTFSLTCIITPNTTGVDTNFTVVSSITGNGISDTERVHVSPQPVLVGENTFETTVTFDHLLEADAGAYTCSAYITSSQPNMIASDTTSGTESITINPLQAPTVSVSPTQGISVEAGGQDTITCTATFDEYLVQRPTLMWEFPGSNIVGTSMGDQSGAQGTTTRTLTFNRIRTSQAGVYTCRATIDIQGIDPLSRTANQTVQVQIPRPVFSVLPHATAYNGTNLTITGRIELDSDVDTPITVSGMWSGDTALQMTTGSPYLIMLSFLPVATGSSGEYNVTYTIRSTDNPQYIIEYNGQDRYSLAVAPLPSRPPTISILSRRELDGCGEVMTLNCTANQVENLFSPPTIVWIDPDNTEVPTLGSSNPRMNPQTGQLIFSDITLNNEGQYTCRAVVNIPQAQIDNYSFGEDTVQVSTNFPGKVGNLACTSISSPSVLSFSWDLPTLLGAEVVSYQVMVNRLEHRTGTREVIQSGVYNQFVKGRDASVPGLAPEVPYNVTVKALNLAGCGEENQTYCFTREGEPAQPTNVMIDRVDSTTMRVSWDKLTLVELKGLADYVVTYSLGGGSRKRQAEGMVTVPWTDNSVTISNLQSGAAYSVTVGARTSAAMSAQTSGTLEAVPGSDIAAIVGGVIAAILVVILVIIIVIIVVYFVRRRRTSKLYSPGHMYDSSKVGSGERELQLQPLDNGSSQPPINDKEKEALEESAIVPPPTEPRSAITTEVLDRMKPVSHASFRDHVASKHEDRDKGFEAEYQSFGIDPVNSHEIAKLPINRPKNRFANIFPYDHSRVTLNELPGEDGSDYINACSLDGYKREGCYIAAQGPMPNTISDFWRMIWERRLPNIVMLTKCLEAGRRKCEQYWADNIGEDYQTPDKKLNITTTSVMPYADFVIRTFSVKSLTDASLDPLSVTQYHFTSWPDHGVPKFATSLISFIRRVQRGHTKDSGRQLLVHCSAGVGRTGTFITLDSMLDRMAAKETDVNVYQFVYNMRQRRVLMVQTLAQYVFIHDALNELITCGQTDIVASALRTKVNFLSKIIPAKGITGFQNQFQLLEQVSRLPVDEDLTDAMEPYNQSKNRYPDKIPYNMSRARLRPTGEDGSEYINASFIDGYKQRNAYIATQGPLQNTVNDIWRMLYEFKSRTLVMLCNMNEEGGEASYPYFPSKEEEAVKYGKMLVTLQSKASYTDFIVRKFSIQEDKQGSPKNDGFVVTQFHLTEWPPCEVTNTGTLIEMLDMITKNQMSTGNRPITVMCNDGVGRTGTFICIHAQLERLKTEGVVDFFQSIKSARIQRAGLVPDVVQYAFCHTVLADYIDKFDNYANFKDMIM